MLPEGVTPQQVVALLNKVLLEPGGEWVAYGLKFRAYESWFGVGAASGTVITRSVNYLHGRKWKIYISQNNQGLLTFEIAKAQMPHMKRDFAMLKVCGIAGLFE